MSNVRLVRSGAADYLIVQAREVLFYIFHTRNNEPLEFSALRIALEAHGVKAEDPNHWGILAAALKNDSLIEAVGRELAVAASRNQAKNSAYRLSRDGWSFAKMLAERRGWGSPKTAGAGTAQQTSLIR